MQTPRQKQAAIRATWGAARRGRNLYDGTEKTEEVVMRRWTILAAMMLAAALISGCSDAAAPAADAGPATDTGADGGGTQQDASFPNKPGGNPLVPEVAAYPFPADFYLKKDSTSASGFRLNIPDAVLPKILKAKVFNGADGFTRLPIILTYLAGGIDSKSLPDPADHALSVGDSSPVWLVKDKTWEKVPILIEIDMMAKKDTDRALIVRPLKLLDEKSTYIVVVRNKLKDLKGNAHKQNAALSALLAGTKTSDPAVEQQRDSFKKVNAALTALKLKAADVVQAWAFTTRSEKQVTEVLLAVQDAMKTATLGTVSITTDKTEVKDGRTNRQVVAKFSVPNFVGKKSGLITLDSSGKPVAEGTRDVEFGFTIPSTVTAKRPVILYGHGFFGSWNQGTRGTWNKIATKYKYNTAATKLGFHEDLENMTTAAIVTDMGKLHNVVAEVIQSLGNVTALHRVVTEQLVTKLTGKDSSGATVTLLDKDKIYYHGISNGGTFGYVVACTSPLLERASLIVGGGGLSHFLQRAVQWNDYTTMLGAIYPTGFEQQLMMSLVQHVLDPVDSINFVPYLVNKRFAGRKPMLAALHMAVNDSQVNNLVTEWVARTAGVKLITPSAKKVYGLDSVTAPVPAGAPATVKGAMFVYDEKVTPSPKTNVPPAKDNKTHGTVRELSVYEKQVYDFLELGKFVQYCTGACDPQ